MATIRFTVLYVPKAPFISIIPHNGITHPQMFLASEIHTVDKPQLQQHMSEENIIALVKLPRYSPPKKKNQVIKNNQPFQKYLKSKPHYPDIIASIASN